jgi:hypothetical protein
VEKRFNAGDVCMNKNYIDLQTQALEQFKIVVNDQFSCSIKDDYGNTYDGFFIAKSPTGLALTVCDVDFQKSATDKKYHPRLIFRRTDKDLVDKKVTGKSITRIIPFDKGQNGYREFWKMISFLKAFEDLVDTGDFDKQYRVVTGDQVVTYLDRGESEIKSVVDLLRIDSTSAFNYLTTIKLLEKYKEEVQSFIDTGASEMTVQNWLDEDNNAYRQDRCMIFGIEFINHKREGSASGNRYDIFTRIGSENEERVIIELKSPSDKIFQEKVHDTNNDPKVEYSLSDSLSRAIPQILEYRKDLESKDAGDSELQKIGENTRVHIAKCVIVIGSTRNDERWKRNLRELRRALSSNLEIWTYTDLINKMDGVIKNFTEKRQKDSL